MDLSNSGAPDRPPVSSRCALCRPSRRDVVLVATIPAMPAASAASAIVGELVLRQIRRDLQEDRDRPRQPPHSPPPPAPAGRQRRLALQVAQAFGVGRGDVDGGEVDMRAAARAAPRAKSAGPVVRCPCWRRGSARSHRAAGGPRAAAPIASMPSLLKPKRLIAARSCGQPEEPRLRIARLRPRRRRADLEKAEAGPRQRRQRHGVLVEARGEPHRVRQLQPGQPRAQPRRGDRPAARPQPRAAAPRAPARAPSRGRSGAGRRRPRRSSRGITRMWSRSGNACRTVPQRQRRRPRARRAAAAGGRDAGTARRRATAPTCRSLAMPSRIDRQQQQPVLARRNASPRVSSTCAAVEKWTKPSARSTGAPAVCSGRLAAPAHSATRNIL